MKLHERVLTFFESFDAMAEESLVLLTYKDEDGDEVYVMSGEDMEVALQHFQDKPKAVFNFHVNRIQTHLDEQQIVYSKNMVLVKKPTFQTWLPGELWKIHHLIHFPKIWFDVNTMHGNLTVKDSLRVEAVTNLTG